MIPPVQRVAAVAVERGIGTPGWKAYRRVLRQVHESFAEHYEMIAAARNEARKAFWHRRNATGDDLKLCIDEAETTVSDLRKHIAAVYDDGKGNNRLILSAEQAEANREGAQFYSAEDLEKELKKHNDNIDRALKGLRQRSYKAKVKCM